MARKGVSSQNISRTDILSEGPVRGLKNGASSVFFNDVASEDAKVRGYNPVETTTSGKITFDGTSFTNTSITGASIPTNLVNPAGAPRQVVLKSYRSAQVTLSNVTGDTGYSSVTCTASSGTPFTDNTWDSSLAYTRVAYLSLDGVLVRGQFVNSSSSVGLFVYQGITDVLDTSKTYELRISYGFYIDSVNSATSLTLKSTYSGSSISAPDAGTYFFEIPPLQSGSNTTFAGKIEGIEVEFRPGHRYQDPLNEIGGVGGSISGTQTVNHELKVIGTGEIPGINPVPEDGRGSGISNTMEAGLPEDSQDDVAQAALILNDTAFGITAAQRAEVDEINIRITYPGGLQYINGDNGKRYASYARYLIQIQTTLDGVNSDWENAFPREGSYVAHTGRTNAAYSFNHVLGVNQYRPFDSFKIRVIRLTRHIGLRINATGHGDGVSNKEKWTLIAKSKVDSLGYVIKDRLSYPYTSLISTSFSSKQYQEPPKMSYLMQGLKVQVPTTYTPREYSSATDSSGNPVAVYEQFWNGTFKGELQYTDNPAWVFYDIVTNNRYGAGKWIRESDIDKYSLYRIARYCDELVDDGAGGVEPRFRSNILLTKATDVYKVLKDFASTFTGMLYWMDGHLTPVQDSPSDPVYNFTKGNVIDGKFGYESSGLKTRSNQVIVTWNDPKSNYEPVPLIVEDREAIVRDKRIITEEVVAFGCTSEAQAIRYGRWKLWTAQKQTEVVSFKSALNSLYIKPGDVVNVQDADREGVQYSGRLSSSTSTAAVLDRSVTLNAGSTYVISTLVTEPAVFYVGASDLRLNSSGDEIGSGGTLYSRGDRITTNLYNHNGSAYTSVSLDTEAKASNAFYKDSSNEYHLLPVVWKEYSYVQENAVTTSAGTTNTIDVSSFGTTPVANSIWALKETVSGLNVLGSYKKYRVLSINQDKSNEYGFSAVEHYDEKYGAVDSGYETGTIPTTIYPEQESPDGEQEMPPPSSPRVILETDADKPGEEIKVEWEPSPSEFVEAYEVKHNIPDIESPITTSDTFLRLSEITSDRLTFQIRAVSTKGNFSEYVTISYTFLDPYEENVPYTPGGIAKGAFATSQLIVTSSNALKFQATNTSVSTISFPEVTYILAGTTDISNISADKDYEVYLDTSVPGLSLLYYDNSSLSSPFYYDVGTGNSSLASSWTSIGSVTIPANSNTVTGTNFTTNLEIGDVLNLSNSTSPTGLANGAIVIDIVSATEAKIDKIFDSAISVTAYRANFRPEYLDDAIIARVRKTGTTINVNSFITLRSRTDDSTTVVEDDGTIVVGTINANHIAANSISADTIQANSINAREINADAINANHIVAGEITADAIAANAITADKVTANSIVATLLTASAVTATDISTTNLSAITANIGDITAGTLKGGSMPDANASPSGSETGAFMDLTNGKMVFGNASKHILFDGTNLVLSGVTVDESSIISGTATPEIIIKDSGTEESTDTDTLNFSTGLDVSVANKEATITLANSGPGAATYGSNDSGIKINQIGVDAQGRITSITTGSTGDITRITAGTGLTGGGTSGDIQLDIADLTVSELAADSIQLSSETFANNDTSLMTSAAIEDKILSYGYTTNAGDIARVEVTAGNGLTGGGSAEEGNFSTTLNVATVTGGGITVNADSIEVDSTVVRTSGAQTINGNKTFGNNVVVTGNLTINGTTTTVNTETVTIADNKILLNSDLTGTPASSVTSGIEVNRGTAGNKSFVYAEEFVAPPVIDAGDFIVGATYTIHTVGTTNFTIIGASANTVGTVFTATGVGSGTGKATFKGPGWSIGSESMQAGVFYGTFVGDVTGTPSSLVGLTTDNLAEGINNLYFTNARVLDAIQAGVGIVKASETLSVDLSELTNMTASMLSSDQFIVLDGGANRRKTASSIPLSVFNNDGGFIADSTVETYINRSYVDKESAQNLATGWYTIAVNGGDRAGARFTIWDTNSGDHQQVVFYAAHHYGTDASNTLTVLMNSYFSGNPFRYIRIKDLGVYDGAALQVYIDDSTNNVNVAIVGDNVQTSGWVLKDWVADATDPGTVSTSSSSTNGTTSAWSSFAERSKIDLDLIAQGGIATTGPMYSGGDTVQYRNLTTNDSATLVNDNTITISAGTLLGGGGDFTVNQGTNETITINHDNVARADSSNNPSAPAFGGTFTAVDSISTSTQGHVTGVNARLVTIPDGVTSATASTVVKRTSAADVQARLFRSNYANQNTISGAIAYRVNNGTDDYIRFCSDAAAIRDFIGAGDITNVTAGTGLSGGGTSGSVTLNLANTSVASGSYTNTNITVDAQGRITAASSGSAGGITSISVGTGLDITSGNTPSISLDLSELASTNTFTTSDQFIVLDNNAERKITASEVISDLSILTGSNTGQLLGNVLSANTITANMIDANSIVSDIIAANSISAQNLSVLATERVNPVSETKNLSGWGGVAEDDQSTITVENIVSYDSVENALEITNKNSSYYNDDTSVSCNSFVVRPDKIYRVAYKVKVDNTTGTFYAGLRYGVSPLNGEVMSTQNDSSTGAGQNTEYEVFQRYDKDRNPESLIKASAHFIPGTAKTNLGTTEYNEYVHYIIGAGRSVNDCPDFVDQNILDGNSTPDTTYPFIKVNTVYVTGVTRTSGGTGYTANGTNVPVLGGSGTGLTVDYTVSGGAVQTTITVNNQGEGYKAGDTLTIPAAEGETAAVLSVASVRDPSSLVTAITGTAVGSSYGASQTKTNIATAPDTSASPNAVGDGLTVNYQTDSSGQVILNTLSINNHGGGYKVGETYKILSGSENAKFTITSISDDNANVALRFLHYNNTTSSTEKKLYIKDISVTEIGAGQIVAQNIQISNNAAGSAGIFMDYNDGDSRIDIRDASALRVRIGYLGT